jgi:hypothetical protein
MSSVGFYFNSLIDSNNTIQVGLTSWDIRRRPKNDQSDINVDMWYKKVEERHNKTIQQLYLGQNRNGNPLNELSIQICTF